MNAKAEEMRAKMKALSIPGLENSVSAGPGPPSLSSGASSPAGSWANRPARPRPSLNVGGGGGGGFSGGGGGGSGPAGGMGLGLGLGGGFGSSAGKRPTPNSLIFTSNSLNSNELEQEHKLKEIMRKSGQLKIHGHNYTTNIDDLELIGDLGNGTSGHVVKMRHRHSNEIIAVKQMRRTGNSDETKRIIMDLDVVLKSHDCEEIVLCLGCFITDSDVWICMELMATCFDKLLKQLKQPIPEVICGKVAVHTVRALHYLKEKHGVIHRDVKPSNILLDTMGRVKLCDFGISGRLVDSKAKTRSAGCAAYMAPERIEPPNPYNPNYDIRADVWSLGITLVEMATGHYPYRDCKTDFELLTKVLQDDPPMLTPNKFSREFELFVRDCLMKDYKDRPKYKKLQMHPFIKKYEKEDIDVGAWYRGVVANGGSLTTPNNNQLISTVSSSVSGFEPLSNISSTERTTFKPQPSPRVTRSWRPSNATPSSPPPSAVATASSGGMPAVSPPPYSPPSQASQQYPSAISEQRENRRPSFEALLEARRYPDLSKPARPTDPSSQYVTSKPPPALPSPSSETTTPAARAGSSYRSHYLTSVTDSPMLMRSSASRRSDHNHYERWQPPNSSSSAASYSPSPYVSPRQAASTASAYSGAASTSSPYSGSYGSPLHYRQQQREPDPEPSHHQTDRRQQANVSNVPPVTVPRYGYRESPRSVRKFDFTYPQTSYHEPQTNASSGGGGGGVATTSQPAVTSSAAAASLTTPRGYARRLSTEQAHHVLPHHYSQYRGRSPTRPQPPHQLQLQQQQAQPLPHHHREAGQPLPTSSQSPVETSEEQVHLQQRSPSQERQSRNYFPSSWRSTLSSWTPSFRRLRTASSDRSSAFDTSRRFQPSYRSWNEKDNFYPSPMKR